MRVDLFQDRIYVISPKGEIVDVPVGGTPLDFAYQVQYLFWAIVPAAPRSMGAWCRSTTRVKKQQKRWRSSPPRRGSRRAIGSRAQSGYLVSPRHRNKVRAWFRKQNATQNKAEGRAMFDREIHRLGDQQVRPSPNY